MKISESLCQWRDEDILQASNRFLAIVVFGATKSINLELALSYARSAGEHQEVKVGKEIWHAAAFAKSPFQAAQAIALIDIAAAWSSTKIYCGGRVQKKINEVLATLHCYLDATQCHDPEAHCLVLREGLFDDYRWGAYLEREAGTVKRFIIPCSMALRTCSIDRDHPSPWEKQIQAAAVKRNTDWCPMFDISKFRQYD